MTTPASEYARLLLMLHDLHEQGKHNSDEANAIREQMDAPWYGMTEQEQELMGQMSEELYDGSSRRTPCTKR